LLLGITKRRPDLTTAAEIVYGRVALPFTGSHDHIIYPQLLASAPADEVDGAVRHAATCLETDSHVDRRVRLLEQLVLSAAERGVPYGVDALTRWRAELATSAYETSDDDPFSTIGTLEELSVLLSCQSAERSWSAVRAFERLAPKGDYEAAKKLFENTEILREDDSCIEAIGTAAMSAGNRKDAELYLDCLRRLAEDRGSWGGGFSSDAKQRFHRLRVKMDGESGRRAAFDAFLDDLAKGREPLSYLLPNLCDVLELISPRLSWADLWVHLREHLSEFREYRIGRDLDPAVGISKGDEYTLADILFRAIDSTVIELSRMARAAAGELQHCPGGPAVVAALIAQLWRVGGHHALEGAQIAWESRNSAEVGELVLPYLPQMAGSDDYAVRCITVNLMRMWGQQPVIKRGPLPPIYGLKLPPNPEADQFNPPSGLSSTCPGLWTEDPFSWTSPLGEALRFTAKASGQELINLRARAAQLMGRMGGTNAFGPEAVERQQTRLRRLSLHATFRRLAATAAFTAMREVVGELAAAERIDPDGLPFILRAAGAFDQKIPTVSPLPRPVGVPAPVIPEPYHTHGMEAWRAASAEDAVAPRLQGLVVLASTAVHERYHFHDRWTVEQYFGSDCGLAEEGLWAQLQCLPSVIIAGGVAPLYEGLAEGAVVYARSDIAGSVESNTVMLCPRVAREVGWRADPQDLFTYRDGRGRVVAQSLFWRDGGIHCREVESFVRRGCILLLADDSMEALRHFVAQGQVAIAWRATEKLGEDKRIVLGTGKKLGAAFRPA
jgi:hypothetical protein